MIMGIWMDWEKEWGKCGIDFWLILGNKTGFGWTNKLSHCGGHFAAVILGRYWYGLPLWLLMLGSFLFGLAYEFIWNKLIEKSGASKLDMVSNNIGMLSAVLCILIKSLMDAYPLFYRLSPYILLIGFALTFTYKVWKLKKKRN